MEAEGIVFRTGVNVGKDLQISSLREEYDAVILCCGSKQPRPLQAEGMEGTAGIYFAVDFLTAATKNVLGSSLLPADMQAKGKHVVVVGGGDTGNDCIGTPKFCVLITDMRRPYRSSAKIPECSVPQSGK